MIKRGAAVAEVLLLVPAALFMTALVLRELPGHPARQIVLWYAGKMWTLWILLIALPMAVLITGGAMLVRAGTELTARRAPVVVVAATTLVSAGILAIVAVHMLTH